MLSMFVARWNGRKCDFDGAFGAQCVDLFRQCSSEVYKTPHTGVVDGAKDLFLQYEQLPGEMAFYTRVKNAQKTRYKPGDFLVWDATDKNKYGHVAILLAPLAMDFIVFEQNGIAQDGAKIALRTRSNLLGALRFKLK